VNGVEVDPAVRQGISFPGGLVIHSDSPSRNSRPRFITSHWFQPSGEYYDDRCIGHYVDDTGPINKRYWGQQRPTEPIPNALAHYLVQPVAGYTGTDGPCLTAAHETQSSSCLRGLSMNFNDSLGDYCRRAVLGHDGLDFTR
jgi:hypothetical protein